MEMLNKQKIEYASLTCDEDRIKYLCDLIHFYKSFNISNPQIDRCCKYWVKELKNKYNMEYVEL